MKDLKELEISDKFVSIFASGDSIKELTPEDKLYLYCNTFVISINEASMISHLRFWQDRGMTLQLKTSNQNNMTCTRPLAMDSDDDFIDYTIYDSEFLDEDALHGCFSLSTLLLFLRKYHPNKILLLFGVDFNNTRRFTLESGHYKEEDRGESYKRKLDRVKNWLERKIRLDDRWGRNIYNCNLNANIDMKKVKYEDIIVVESYTPNKELTWKHK